MTRREFTRAQKAAIVHRAMNDAGQVVCEKCGLVLGAKVYEIDHRVPEALVIDKTKPLTIADGWLLGLDCCHRPKTAIDKGVIAKAVRREANSLGFAKARNPMPGSKASRWRKPFNGPAVLR